MKNFSIIKTRHPVHAPAASSNARIWSGTQQVVRTHVWANEWEEFASKNFDLYVILIEIKTMDFFFETFYKNFKRFFSMSKKKKKNNILWTLILWNRKEMKHDFYSLFISTFSSCYLIRKIIISSFLHLFIFFSYYRC